MSRKFLFLVLLILPLFAACNEKVEKTGGIAVVDLARVQKESQLVAGIQAHLGDMNKQFMAELMEAEKNRNENPGEESDQRLQATITRLQEAMYKEQERLGGFLSAELKKVLEDYRVEKKLDALLLKEAVAAMDPSMDATNEIMGRLDKLSVDLTMPETAAPAEAAETPATETPAPEAVETPAETPATETPATEAPAPAAPAE